MSDPADLVATVGGRLSQVWLSRLKIGAIATMIGAGFSFASSVIGKFDLVNTAMAQTQAKADSAVDRTNRLETRLEAIDAGTRLAVERLERKIDTNAEQAQKERAEDRALLKTVLAEIKKR